MIWEASYFLFLIYGVHVAEKHKSGGQGSKNLHQCWLGCCLGNIHKRETFSESVPLALLISMFTILKARICSLICCTVYNNPLQISILLLLSSAQANMEHCIKNTIIQQILENIVKKCLFLSIENYNWKWIETKRYYTLGKCLIFLN